MSVEEIALLIVASAYILCLVAPLVAPFVCLIAMIWRNDD